MEALEGNVAKDLAAMESELKDTMAANQKENKSIANANQAELKNILSELESGLKDQADQNLTQIVNQFSGLEALTKQNFAELNENLDLSVADLKNQMDNLHEQISKTQGEITEILTAMDKNRTSSIRKLWMQCSGLQQTFLLSSIRAMKIWKT